jgi:hypothetical protein
LVNKLLYSFFIFRVRSRRGSSQAWSLGGEDTKGTERSSATQRAAAAVAAAVVAVKAKLVARSGAAEGTEESCCTDDGDQVRKSEL